MHHDDKLSTALTLPPLSGSPVPFVNFLAELAEHPERAETAPAVVLRAIEAMGQEEVSEEQDPERKRFLQALKDLGIPSWKAFHHVCGSQLFAYRLIKRFLEPAAANGAQLKKLLIVLGGPGAGKDFFKDGIEAALEKHGRVYAVKGCPDHENPLNLLTLLEDDQLAQIAEATDIELDVLKHMLVTAGQPCQHCYEKVMGTLDDPKEKPNLAEIEVEEIRLTKRSTGIFTWTPGQACSLVAALRRANRGFVSMPDAFIEREPEPGSTDERLILLDATQYRRLPGQCDDKSRTVSASPLDIFMMATTNENALKGFLKTLPDQDAFTGRSEELKLPYNLFLVEEVRAYETALQDFKSDERAKFGPLALRMIATLAVISRYAVPEKGKPFIHPIDRMRLLQGEQLKVKPRTNWDEIWSTDDSSSDSVSGGSFSGSRSFGRTTETSSPRPSTNTSVTAKALPDNVPITPNLMLRLVSADEGLEGLDMRFMMSLLSRINRYGLGPQGDEDDEDTTGDNSVTALEAIMLLRTAIYQKLADDSNLTEGQKAVLERCQTWLGGVPTPGETWTKQAAEKPGLIESEYRRLLKQVLLRVFCPDYEARAAELYDDYRVYAEAWAQGKDKVDHPKLGKESPVNETILDKLDRFRVGKGKLATLTDEDKEFRSGLVTALDDAKEQFMARELRGLEVDGPDYREKRKQLAREYEETWTTVPELAIAIRAYLDDEIGEAVQKLLTTEVVSNLEDDELERLKTAKTMLEELGYSQRASKRVLEYAKRVKVWNHQA